MEWAAAGVGARMAGKFKQASTLSKIEGLREVVAGEDTLKSKKLSRFNPSHNTREGTTCAYDPLQPVVHMLTYI